MSRLVEIIVAANALCGIIVFLGARAVFRKAKKKVLGDELPPAPPQDELPRRANSCRKCGSSLNRAGLCTDETCPYSERAQDESYTVD